MHGQQNMKIYIRNLQIIFIDLFYFRQENLVFVIIGFHSTPAHAAKFQISEVLLQGL